MLSHLFVDLNSFFASVEQQERPALRGKPVAVVPVDADSTAVIAASYEAKRFGIKTGTRVGEAKRMCPGLILVMGRTTRYLDYHLRILRAAESVLPVKDGDVHSIDEFSCRLMGAEREPEAALELGRRMKRAITDQVGQCMTASVGIGPSRFIAKVGSDMQKPDGLTLIQKHELPARLFHLVPQDLPGIGPRMTRRLASCGITTVEELASRSEPELIKAWGSILGSYWYGWLRGESLDHAPSPRRTIGHEHVLPPPLRTADGARAVLVRLIHKAAARARALGYVARRLSLAIRHLDGTKWKHEAQFPECSDTLSLVQRLAEAWDSRPPMTAPPLKVRAVLTELSPISAANLGLFEEARRREGLSRAMDTLNGKYGKNTVYLASMHDAQDAAPTRIAFGNIPDLNTPDARDEEVDEET